MRLQALKNKVSERRASAQQWQHNKESAQTNPGLGKKPGTSPSTTNLNGQNFKRLVTYNPLEMIHFVESVASWNPMAMQTVCMRIPILTILLDVLAI